MTKDKRWKWPERWHCWQDWTSCQHSLSLNYPVSSRFRTILLVLSLKLLSPVRSLPSVLSTGSESLNASNTSSSHLPTKFLQLPNIHTFITSSLFNVLAVLALHLLLRLATDIILSKNNWSLCFVMLHLVAVINFFISSSTSFW